MACTAFEVNGTALDIAPTETAVELPEEPPIDELRVETQPEPSVYTAPVVTKV